MKTCNYINGKGKEVEVRVSGHAKEQFKLRWFRLHGKPLPMGAEEFIANKFKGATRIKNLSNKEKKRVKKHSGETLYFRNGDFTFVVHNAIMVTIEISGKGKRDFNSGIWKENNDGFVVYI